MSLFMGLIGGAGKGASELADQWGKERADKELEKQRSDQAMEREKTLMRLKMDMADTQRVKRAGEIEAGTKALIGKKLEGHEVADKSTWTPEMEAARNAGVADMTARAPADVAASLGYLDEAKDLQSIQASKDTSAYHTRSLDIQAQKAAADEAHENKRDDLAVKQFELAEKKAKADMAHNAGMMALAKDKLSPAMEYQMKGAAHAIDLAATHVRDLGKSLDTISKEADTDGKKAERVAEAKKAYDEALKDAATAKTVYNITGTQVFGDKWKTIETPKAEVEKQDVRVIGKDGKPIVIGQAATREEGAAMMKEWQSKQSGGTTEPAKRGVLIGEAKKPEETPVQSSYNKSGRAQKDAEADKAADAQKETRRKADADKDIVALRAKLSESRRSGDPRDANKITQQIQDLMSSRYGL